MMLKGKIYKLNNASSQLIFNKKALTEDTITALSNIKIIEINYKDMRMKLFTRMYEDNYKLRFRITKAYADWFDFRITEAVCEVKGNKLIVSVQEVMNNDAGTTSTHKRQT